VAIKVFGAPNQELQKGTARDRLALSEKSSRGMQIYDNICNLINSPPLSRLVTITDSNSISILHLR
jgi:hypothetical protein